MIKTPNILLQKLCQHGIDLKETRIIPDDELLIINTISEVRLNYNYIFTTGGIGPTHDDITSAAIAKCFNRPLEINDHAYNSIKEFYKKRNQELNDARIKMSYVPKDSELIDNPVSSAPGFIIENVYVLPGVPSIMQSMFDLLLKQLPMGARVKSLNLDVMLPESIIAAPFAKLQAKYSAVEMGSYPFEKDGRYATSLVLRSNDLTQLEQSHNELSQLIIDNFPQ